MRKKSVPYQNDTHLVWLFFFASKQNVKLSTVISPNFSEAFVEFSACFTKNDQTFQRSTEKSF